VCVLDPAAMPEHWRPTGADGPLPAAPPWTDAEQAAADAAVDAGVGELVALILDAPGAKAALGDDAVEAFIDLSYSSDADPGRGAAARLQATAVLETLAAPWLERSPDSVGCVEVGEALTVAVYADALWRRGGEGSPPLAPPRPDAVAHLAAAATHAAADCGTVPALLGYDPAVELAAAEVSVDTLYDMVMWSITLADAQGVPGLTLPPGAETLTPRLWQRLASRTWVDAAAYPERGNDAVFYDTAYLATHVAYILTGYGRYGLRASDAPWLVRFLRANFYAVLEMGELDLAAEFVDLFRQLGCTERNDRQTLDGTRHLLALYAAAGGSWKDHRESYETAESNLYDLVHKPWTAVAGVRPRTPRVPPAGSYGARVRTSLGLPDAPSSAAPPSAAP